MNKWWLAGFAFPAIAGIVWIAAKDGANEHSSARPSGPSPSSKSAASPPFIAAQTSDVPRQKPIHSVSPNSEPKPVAAVSAKEPLPTKDLQELLDKDPAVALLQARKDLIQDPNGPNAAERSWVVVKSLAVLGRYEEARGEAKTLVEKFPGTRWANDVERHILAHP